MSVDMATWAHGGMFGKTRGERGPSPLGNYNSWEVKDGLNPKTDSFFSIGGITAKET